MLNYIIPLFCYVSGVLAHDFHISVCEIEYDEQSETLEITHRLFLDDLEETLRSWSGNQSVDVLNPADEKELQKLIGKYLLEKFSVKVNSKESQLTFLGSEPDGDVMYCYIELEGVKRLNSIYVMNQILMEKFDDQMNMMHIYRGGKTTSTRFSKRNTTFMIDFE